MSVRFQALHVLDVQTGGRKARQTIQQQVLDALPAVKAAYQMQLQAFEQELDTGKPPFSVSPEFDRERLNVLKVLLPELKQSLPIEVRRYKTKLLLSTGPGFREVLDSLISRLLLQVRRNNPSHQIKTDLWLNETDDYTKSRAYVATFRTISEE
jgi:hypothetical protein